MIFQNRHLCLYLPLKKTGKSRSNERVVYDKIKNHNGNIYQHQASILEENKEKKLGSVFHEKMRKQETSISNNEKDNKTKEENVSRKRFELKSNGEFDPGKEKRKK